MDGSSERLRLEIRGVVQGVGFRPFLYRLATDARLTGWVVNDTRGVFVEVEGRRAALEEFLARVRSGAPPHASIRALDHQWLPAAGFERFEIRESDGDGPKSATLLPDLAPCAECLAEIENATERRHRYPFTNCTRCGPRFTIIRALPYDRPNTTMAGFALCGDCRREYRDPTDRRFHAQPIACPQCGPRLALTDARGGPLARDDEALARAAAELRAGRIAAVKGVGGYHLLCDAANAHAVRLLRERKPRHEKPFALMARDLGQAHDLVEIDDAAAAALLSAERPIVLLQRRAGADVAEEVAPGLPTLGVMLPSSPLHHLLLHAVARPVVATSGNLSDEPIAIDDEEARRRLGPIADVFLGHDRPIERHVDDSVGWFPDGTFRLLRRARGWAPLPVPVSAEWPALLAVGGHLKNTVALAVGRSVLLSQHIGDLETPEAEDAFERVVADLLRMYDASPRAIAHDMHPDYISTRAARRLAAERAVPAIAVQHHHAHLAACLAEHGLEGSALGIIWDGTGYGTDGTIWGGEFLVGDRAGFERVAHLRPFRLPGGDAAVREPRRAAIALLWELLGPAALERTDLAPVAAFTESERAVLQGMLATGVNSPVTTSAGRLCDGVAGLLGLKLTTSFEGQAAMALEFAADPHVRDAYPLPLTGAAPRVLDWRETLEAVLADLARGTDRGIVAARFHHALIDAAVAVAREVGEGRVALGGGCFQNRILARGVLDRLKRAGHDARMPELVPVNDGGLSLGQAAVAAARLGGASTGPAREIGVFS